MTVWCQMKLTLFLSVQPICELSLFLTIGWRFLSKIQPYCIFITGSEYIWNLLIYLIYLNEHILHRAVILSSSDCPVVLLHYWHLWMRTKPFLWPRCLRCTLMETLQHSSSLGVKGELCSSLVWGTEFKGQNHSKNMCLSFHWGRWLSHSYLSFTAYMNLESHVLKLNLVFSKVSCKEGILV